MLWPNGSTLQPTVSSPFGARPGVGAFPFHYGVDLVGFTVARAIGAGRVTYAGWLNASAGNTVTIDHGDGVTSLQMHHLARIDVARSQLVATAQPLGTPGRTGNATGICLHLEIRVHGTSVDPIPYLRARLDGGATTSMNSGKEPEMTADMSLIRNPSTGDVFAVAPKRVRHLGTMSDVRAAEATCGQLSEQMTDRRYRVALIIRGIPYAEARAGADWWG